MEKETERTTIESLTAGQTDQFPFPVSDAFLHLYGRDLTASVSAAWIPLGFTQLRVSEVVNSNADVCNSSVLEKSV